MQGPRSTGDSSTGINYADGEAIDYRNVVSDCVVYMPVIIIRQTIVEVFGNNSNDFCIAGPLILTILLEKQLSTTMVLTNNTSKRQWRE